jgi:hypothetical protein
MHDPRRNLFFETRRRSRAMTAARLGEKGTYPYGTLVGMGGSPAG